VSLLKLAYRTAGTAIWENADAIFDLDKSLFGTDYHLLSRSLPLIGDQPTETGMNSEKPLTNILYADN
jgi:hypothetical protein